MKFNRFVLKHFGVNIFRTLTALNRVEYVWLFGMPVNELFILLSSFYLERHDFIIFHGSGGILAWFLCVGRCQWSGDAWA